MESMPFLLQLGKTFGKVTEILHLLFLALDVHPFHDLSGLPVNFLSNLFVDGD